MLSLLRWAIHDILSILYHHLISYHRCLFPLRVSEFYFFPSKGNFSCLHCVQAKFILIFNGRLLYPFRKLPSIWADSLSAVCGGGEGKPHQQLRATMQQERRVRGTSVRQKLCGLLVRQSLGRGSAWIPSYAPGHGSMQRYGRLVQGWGLRWCMSTFIWFIQSDLLCSESTTLNQFISEADYL